MSLENLLSKTNENLANDMKIWLIRETLANDTQILDSIKVLLNLRHNCI